MTTTVFRGGAGGITLAVDDGVVTAVGTDLSGATADLTVDLEGGVVLPAFVDAHVHATQTGLMLDGLDLHGCRSRDEVLDRVAAAVRCSRGRVVIGTGWDETTWADRRRPTAAELDRAAFGGAVYLARADVHSAVASSALLHLAGVSDHDDGWVRLDAHHDVRRAALAALTRGQIRDAQARCLTHAASLGVARVHEMAGPEVSSVDDLAALLELAPELGVEVVGLWARLGDVEVPRELGLAVAGGDLFCDGSVGSRTAALSEDYADDEGNRGALRFGVDQLVEHLVLAARAGLTTDFHVIGDAAIEQVLDAHEQAGDTVPAVTGSRLEHVELATARSIERIAALGLVASVQPAFDAQWGGPAGMYVDRLGPRRAALMNPYRSMHEAGVPLLFGSDAPVCPIDPWGGVRAAVHHRTTDQALDVAAAFAAHSTGPLVAGAPATFAVWSHDGTVELDRTPDCVRTVVAGRTVFEAGR